MVRERPSRSSRAASATIQKLESLERAGVKTLGKPRSLKKVLSPAAAPLAGAKAAPLAGSKAVPPASANRALPASAAPPSKAVEAPRPTAIAPPSDTLAIIRQEVADCTRCDELAATRTQTVFGVGNPHARLCFLGEAPGADEDRQGEPFVGRAGQLLTKIIEACTLTREDVYILNVLKCRPPANRTPLPHEVANCRGFLDRQLSLIRPEYICCLGTVAAQTLLQTDTPIGRMRGKFLDYQGIPVMCTYHPAYLLRNPAAKKDVWEDMKLLMRKLGIEL